MIDFIHTKKMLKELAGDTPSVNVVNLCVSVVLD